MKAYCFKCQQEMEIKHPQEVKMKNGNYGTEGVCCRCGTKVYRVGKRKVC